MKQCWEGMLLRRSGGALALPDTVYWSRAPLATGEAYELAGWTELSEFVESERALRRFLAIPQTAELVAYSDPKQSAFRYAGVEDGRLVACVFFARPGAGLPGGDQVARKLGQPLEPQARLALLAGLDTRIESPGKIVCCCFTVGEALISSTVRSKQLRTPEEIGAVLHAGTNCGSCIPELKKLLAAESQRASEVA
jgi:assimilatory nitrate reductase catalytic subunit